MTRDKKARRCGIPLEKFPSFIRVLKEQLSNDFESNYKLEVKPKVHQAKLSAITLAAVESAIQLIDFDELNERNEKSVEKFRSIIKGKNVDLEIECQNFVSSLEKNVASVIGVELINRLRLTSCALILAVLTLSCIFLVAVCPSLMEFLNIYIFILLVVLFYYPIMINGLKQVLM